MKTTMTLLTILLVCLFFIPEPTSAGVTEAAEATVKIGTFDSRVIALAYFRSADYQLVLSEFHKNYQKAKAENNDSLIKTMEKEGPWNQIRMHLQVFSNAGTANIMSKIANELPKIAREAGVLMIVSQWEMPYCDATVETVDVTMAIAKLFKPDEQTLNIIKQMKGQDPIPFDKLPLDPMM